MAYTYIAKNQLGLIKVGRSTNVPQRIKDIESSSGFSVELIHHEEGAYFEKQVHLALKDKNKIGEWFECSAEEAVAILKDLKEKEKQVIESIPKDDSTPLSELPDDQFVLLPYSYLTKSDLDKRNKIMVEKLVETAGSKVHLAVMLGLPLPTINSWVNRGQVSKKGAQLVEQHETLGEKYKASDLRPELEIYEN